MAIQPDPYFALPSLRGAPAYSRPPRRTDVTERPLDPDDFPLASYQTDEERRLASALPASHSHAALGVGMGGELAGSGDPGYRTFGFGARDRAHEPVPNRLRLRGLTDRILSRS